MRIFLDAMGGDNAPQAPVAGAIEALRKYPQLEITLAGDPAALTPLLTTLARKQARGSCRDREESYA